MSECVKKYDDEEFTIILSESKKEIIVEGERGGQKGFIRPSEQGNFYLYLGDSTSTVAATKTVDSAVNRIVQAIIADRDPKATTSQLYKEMENYVRNCE